jgi:hypothetical protein
MRRICCRAGLMGLVMAMGMSGCSSSPPISVSVSAATPAIDQTQTVHIAATVTNDKSSTGVMWNLNGAGSLSGSTAFATNYNSPTSAITSAQQVTITATSVADSTKMASVQITVNPYPEIPFLQTLANGTVGAAYSQTIQLTGGTPPFQWSVYDGPVATGYMVGGAVPDGLTLNATTGVISGTPTGGGTWYFEAIVTDATGANAADGLLSVQINPSAAAAANAVPFLNQTLVPTAVSPGSTGFTLHLSGTGFASGATAYWNSTTLSTTFVDSEHLAAMVPAASAASAGTASVTVLNPTLGGGRSNVVYLPIGSPEATVTFANAKNSPLQLDGAVDLATADFNEDGKPDLAISGIVAVYVYLSNGDGTFAQASGSPLRVPSPPYDDFPSPYVQPIVSGDFNNSGHLGMALGMPQNAAAAIFFGSGNGTFTTSSTLANTMGQPTTAVLAADFNGDGNLDLVAVNSLNGLSPVVLLGYGDGAFNNVQQNVQISGPTLAAGDFNGDGKLDLVLNGPNILLGNGDGTFMQGASLNAQGFITVADFNGDGKLDLAVCDDLSNTVTILLGDGTGNFTMASGSPITVGNAPEAIIAADFNDDGKMDLAVANFNDGTATLLLGNGDGTFTQAAGSPYTVGQEPIALAVADFNGDGKLDLAVANLESNTVSILLQQ